MKEVDKTTGGGENRRGGESIHSLIFCVFFKAARILRTHTPSY